MLIAPSAGEGWHYINTSLNPAPLVTGCFRFWIHEVHRFKVNMEDVVVKFPLRLLIIYFGSVPRPKYLGKNWMEVITYNAMITANFEEVDVIN